MFKKEKMKKYNYIVMNIGGDFGWGIFRENEETGQIYEHSILNGYEELEARKFAEALNDREYFKNGNAKFAEIRQENEELKKELAQAKEKLARLKECLSIINRFAENKK